MSISSGLNIAAKYKRKGRASRTIGQLWQVPMFVIGLAAVAVVAASTTFQRDTDTRQFDRDVRELRALLADENSSSSAAAELTESLVQRAQNIPSRTGVAHYLAGKLYYRIGRTQNAREATQSFQTALVHLEKAKQHDVPQADIGSLNETLGKLYFAKNDHAAARTALAKAVEYSLDDPATVYTMLVESLLKAKNPDYQAALAANQGQLKHLLDQDAVYKAWLTRGRIFSQLKQWDKAYKALNNVDKSASKTLQVESRLLQAEAAEAQGIWRRSLEHWQQLTSDAEAAPGGIGRVWYSIGLAHQRTQPPNNDAAVEHFEKAVKKGGKIAQAARLRLGELYLLGQTPDAAIALGHIQKALENIASPKDYSNPWLSLQDASRMMENTRQFFLNNHLPELVNQWASAFAKLATPGPAREQLAVILETYARAAQKQPKPNAEEMHDLFRRAAVAYVQSSKYYKAKKKSALLWRCAVCYREAKAHAEAIPVLDQYVVVEPVPDHQAKGWYALAEMHQKIENRQQARHAFEQCIAFRDSTYAYKARYQLALDAEVRGDFDEAITFLKANRVPSTTIIHRKSHEDSLYKLASLFVSKKDYDKAYLYLQEASRQYPNNSLVYGVRNQLAGVFKAMGEETGRKLLGKVPEHMRGILLKERRQWLKKAADTYDQLADSLADKQIHDTTPFSKDDRRMQQRAEFSAADMHMGLNEYDEALRRYQQLLVKYPRERAGLLAGERVFHCMSFMRATPNERKRGHKAVVDAMAKLTAYLKEMPSGDAAFKNLPDQEVRSKKEWVDWVDWVNKHLTKGKPGPLDAPGTTERTSKRTPTPTDETPQESPKPSPKPLVRPVAPPPTTPPEVTTPTPAVPSFAPPKIN